MTHRTRRPLAAIFARDTKRITQTRLAEVLGVTQQTVSNWTRDGVSDKWAAKVDAALALLGAHPAAGDPPADARK